MCPSCRPGAWWLQVRALRSGNATAIADILRLVEEAQARTAPVQRLADAVAGKFAYAVMGVSAATFAFWATLGTRVFPQARLYKSISILFNAFVLSRPFTAPLLRSKCHG